MSLFSSSEKVLCAFCKLPRRVYKKNEVSIFDAVILLFVTALFAYLVWGGPDVRSLLVFMTLAFVLQVFVRVRWRESLKCQHCGFDPIVYKRNNTEAALAVKDYLEYRKDNPKFLLKPQPKIKPLIVKAEKGLLPLAPSQNETPEDLLDQPVENYQESPLDII